MFLKEDKKLYFTDYADQYDHIMKEGHHYQAPACGSPSITWHMGICPKYRPGENPLNSNDTIDNHEIKNQYDIDYYKFISSISKFAEKLQNKGRIGETSSFEFDATPNEKNLKNRFNFSTENHQYIFNRYKPQTLSFTLWWPEDIKVWGGRKPDPKKDFDTIKSALRIRTQFQAHADYVMISFVIDASKPYNENQIEFPEDRLDGVRRKIIRNHLHNIRKSASEQIHTGAINIPRIPEANVSEETADALIKAADYLYDSIWKEFARDFQFLDIFESSNDNDSKAEPIGVRFIDYRGHVMSIKGLETPQDIARKKIKKELKVLNRLDQGTSRGVDEQKAFDVDFTPDILSGDAGLGPYQIFDHRNHEGNTILKSLWPFLRRMSPWADYREFVGCGIMEGRSIFTSALGSGRLDIWENEESLSRTVEVPSGKLPLLEKIWNRHKEISDSNHKILKSQRDKNRPVRYLIISKGEPHREQLGRFVERLHAIETMRAFSIRRLRAIRNASIHLELAGRKIDGLIRDWSRERNNIEKHYQKIEESIKNKEKSSIKFIFNRRKINENYFEITSKEIQESNFRKIDDLSQAISKTERRLIDISGWLDDIGEGGSGRIMYAINRAMLSIRNFNRMYPTLNIHPIASWTSYNQFIERGIYPAFDFIEITGDRLQAVQARLQKMTEVIQTAALINETEATRQNTEVLNKIARNFRMLNWGTPGLFLILADMAGWLPVKDWLKLVLEMIM